MKKAVPIERLEKKKERVAEKANFVNKGNAIKRMNLKLNGKAIVRDKDEEKEASEKPFKRVKKNVESDTLPIKNFKNMAKVNFMDNENQVTNYIFFFSLLFLIEIS